ncbi:MAG: type II toxin-antitoxin system Phd/YefM family antitoxin [Gemmatimonadota bacterium]
MVIMRRASIAELKARLSEFLAAAKRGEDVIVTERGRPIARLTAVAKAEAMEARMAELVRAGLVKPPTAKLPREFFTEPLPAAPDADIVRAVLDEREEGW